MQYSSVTIDNLEFNYNDGGAVSLYQSSEFQINDSTFYGNRADSGGAISISIVWVYRSGNDSQDHVQISNTAFYSKMAQYKGGALYLFYKGSYWYYKYLQLQIHNTTFHSNIAHYIDGGAVYIHMQPYTDFETQNWLSITDSRFINNTASQGNGGAIVLSELRQKINCTNPSVINKCQFVNNMARKASGGAIYKNGKNTELAIYQNFYANNTANTFGRAIYVGGTKSSVYVTDTTFRNNVAIRESGGAIHSSGQYTNVTLTLPTFHNNSASYCGVLNVDN